MTFTITQPCIDTMDQSCVEVCPVDCIHFDQDAGDRMLYINPAECIDCGACQPACPVSAIFPEADVPEGSKHFTEINALWFTDPAAARAQVGGGAAAPAAPSAAPAAAAASATPVEAAPTAAAAPEPEAAPAAAAAAPAAAPAAAGRQMAVEPEVHRGPVVVPEYSLPSPLSVVALIGLAASVFVMVMFPGPTWLEIGALDWHIGPVEHTGDLHASHLLLLPLVLVFLGMFVRGQAQALGGFAARQGRRLEAWREGNTEWRRSEESRQYDLERAVQELAQVRFGFPDDRHPSYRTHVNVPNPSMALEFGGGGGVKVFPDILVVDYPGNYPVMVAQVETRETVTRAQAAHVWKQLENDEAPLYIYVPTGMAAVAKDYARSAGIKHARIRTWRRLPGTMAVQEL